MKWTRREFFATAGLVGLAGCARIEQSRLGRITPDLEFGGGGPIRFAVLHHPELLDSRSVGIVGRAVNAINNDETIDFTVAVGNLTSHGSLQEMKLAAHALARLHQPYHCVPGPRDSAAGGDAPLRFYERTFKKPQWKLSMGGWALIGLDTSNGGNPQAPLGDSALAELRAQLEHVDPQKPIALFAHHALAPGADEGRLANADQVLELFANRNLKLVLSSQGLENRTEEHQGTIFISTVPCSTTADTPADKRGIRVISIDGAQMAHEFVLVPL